MDRSPQKNAGEVDLPKGFRSAYQRYAQWHALQCDSILRRKHPIGRMPPYNQIKADLQWMTAKRRDLFITIIMVGPGGLQKHPHGVELTREVIDASKIDITLFS